MSDDLVKWWDEYVESMGCVMGEVEHKAQQMRDRIEGLEAQLQKQSTLMDIGFAEYERRLATARRDALEEAAMVAYEHFPATQDMESTKVCNALEDVAAAIRALTAQEEPKT